MTPADAPNASDRLLAATKPPEHFAAQPTSNAAAHSPVPAAAQRQPGVHPIIAACATQLRVAARSKLRFTIAGAIRSP